MGLQTYDRAAQAASQQVTEMFSDSFKLASRLFAPSIRPHIYNIYGLVRLADEIADSYTGADALQRLDELEAETLAALARGFSSNLIVHAFQLSAGRFAIGPQLITPFFASMRTDIVRNYTPAGYHEYIYGSAEVVGLMCLHVFCQGDGDRYQALQPGARALGAALQKVNFLRDLADDHAALGRYYFPEGSFDTFDETTKRAIITDIEHDFATAQPAFNQLPRGARPAVLTAATYYQALLAKLKATPAASLKQHRVRLPNQRKLLILGTTVLRERLRG